MQLTFLGTCAADVDREAIQAVCPDRFDPDHRRYAAALLDGHILIDCGPTVPEAMRILGADPQAVTDLIITHTHEDHFDRGSLDIVVGNRQEPLRIWCELNAWRTGVRCPRTLLCPLIAGQPVQLDTLTLTPLAAEPPGGRNPRDAAALSDRKKRPSAVLRLRRRLAAHRHIRGSGRQADRPVCF